MRSPLLTLGATTLVLLAIALLLARYHADGRSVRSGGWRYNPRATHGATTTDDPVYAPETPAEPKPAAPEYLEVHIVSDDPRDLARVTVTGKDSQNNLVPCQHGPALRLFGPLDPGETMDVYIEAAGGLFVEGVNRQLDSVTPTIARTTMQHDEGALVVLVTRAAILRLQLEPPPPDFHGNLKITVAPTLSPSIGHEYWMAWRRAQPIVIPLRANVPYAVLIHPRVVPIEGADVDEVVGIESVIDVPPIASGETHVVRPVIRSLTGEIRGRLVASEDPVCGAVIAFDGFSSHESHLPYVLVATTDAHGVFVLRGPLEGCGYVRVVQLPVDVTGYALPRPRPLIIPRCDGAADVGVLGLGEGGRIEGTWIRGARPTHIVARCWSGIGVVLSPTWKADVDSEGRFAFPGLEAGPYLLQGIGVGAVEDVPGTIVDVLADQTTAVTIR